MFFALRDGVSRIYYPCSRDGGKKWFDLSSGQPMLPPQLGSGGDQHDSEHEHEYTGYSFEFVVKFHQRAARGKNSALLVTTEN
jgi:hypothetical protein